MKTHPIYTVEYFIDKFSKIPEELWCTRVVTLEEDGLVKHCAIGWCDRVNEGPESWKLFQKINAQRHHVNNGDDPRYQQLTPKQRILAALRDIQAMQNPKPVQQEAKPERVVYVTVDAEVRDLQKRELVQN